MQVARYVVHLINKLEGGEWNVGDECYPFCVVLDVFWCILLDVLHCQLLPALPPVVEDSHDKIPLDRQTTSGLQIVDVVLHSTSWMQANHAPEQSLQ
jgi:hypothetical protein